MAKKSGQPLAGDRNLVGRWVGLLVLTLVGSSALAAGPVSGQARVIDGDTLAVGTARIRLAGIDAVELHQTCTGHDGAIYQCGHDAKAVMTELIRGMPVTCQPQARPDRYGRLIAVCATETVPDLGRAMVERGWAVDYRQYDRSCAYCAAEAEARAAGRGVWSGRFDPPAQWRNHRAHSG